MFESIVIIAVLVAIAIGFYWWITQKPNKDSIAGKEEQLLSFVALLKRSQRIEPIYIKTAVKKAFDADLSCGDEDEAEDGFVVGDPAMPTLIVNLRGRMIMINNFDSPYVEDPQEASESIPDLRLRKLVSEHTAWLSCDALGVDSFDDHEEVKIWYQVLGRLFTELIDDNCLAIMLPQTGQVYPNMDETLERLKSYDPVMALDKDAPAPVVSISSDSPQMMKAVAKAKDTFSQFVSAFRKDAGENFAVKAPITVGDQTEFIWINVTAIENGVIYGTLGNEPVDLGSLTIGSNVKTKLDDMNDWGFIDENGQPQGMFTVKVIANAQKEMLDDD